MSGHIVWTHDPCQEGGWRMEMRCETLREAIDRANEINADEGRMRQEQTEFVKR